MTFSPAIASESLRGFTVRLMAEVLTMAGRSSRKVSIGYGHHPGAQPRRDISNLGKISENLTYCRWAGGGQFAGSRPT